MRKHAAWTGIGLLFVLVPGTVLGQHVDVTVFAGQAFPVLEGRLVLRPPAVPSLPGVEVTSTRTPELRTDGGLVFGVAAAVEFGLLGIEGRLDATDVGFDIAGGRYDLRATTAPFAGLTGSVSIGDGRLDLERLTILSLNVRLRTPGPIGFQASGGISYLPDIEVAGSVPLNVELAGLPALPAVQPRLTLVATPDQSADRWGLNAGVGIRVGGRVALVAEARIFYFRDYELRFAVDDPLPFVNELAASVDRFRFEPVFVNAQAGIVVRF